MNYIQQIEQKFLNSFSYNSTLIKVGNIVRIGYLISEGEKETIQYYQGLITGIKNHGIAKTFTIERNVQGISIKQTILVFSPKIVSITKINSFKVRRAKLYFMYCLNHKKHKLKIIS